MSESLHEVWGPPVRRLRYREEHPEGDRLVLRWIDVPELRTPPVLKDQDWQPPLSAADTPVLCFTCGQEYRFDSLAHSGPMVCPHCGAGTTYERSRRLLQQRYPGLPV